MGYSQPGSSVHGVLQTRILAWVIIPPGDLPKPGIKPAFLRSLILAGGFLPLGSATWEAR